MASLIDDIPLEDDVPAPKPVSRLNRYKKVVNGMSVNQSFVVYGRKEAYRARNATRIPSSKGKLFTMRREGDFFRLWRVK